MYHPGNVSHSKVQQSHHTDSHVSQPKGEYLHIGIVQREQVILSLRSQGTFPAHLFRIHEGSTAASQMSTSICWRIITQIMRAREKL